ncbi:MAG: hydantoinase/oxoprolinase N-terminal domain-containing protein [Bacteroidales bacterium]
MDRYVIGIDTGGTFTDGVLLHYESRKVISAAKSLTTREDLKIGVIKVLKKLNIKEEYSIKLVGISSTLATNSVAEGKARKVGLLLIGYDQDLVEQYGLTEKLSTENISYFKGGHNAQGNEAAPLDEESIKKWIQEKESEFDAVAVSSYFSPLNPEHEERAFEIIKEQTDLPVVMASQLSTKLNSIKRAATAAINASLVAVMQDFIQAVQNSLQQLGIEAPLMIVRGDGTMMPYTEAVQKPVETVLSGPAASAIGGRFLARDGSALVIDMGSTTTDMALVKDSRVVVSEEGAKVGDTETAVEAAKIRTISVGCDSRISYNKKKDILIGPDRVRPLSQIARHHKKVASEIQSLKNTTQIRKNLFDIEYWYLHKPLDENTLESLNEKQRKAVELIAEPHRLSDLLSKVGVFHPSHLHLDGLIQEGKIECAALTPSDLLHVEGGMNMWDADTAFTATDYYCQVYGVNRKEFIETVFDKIVDIIVEEILIFLACQNLDYSRMPDRIDGEWGKWMLQEILHSDNNYLSIDAGSRFPVIGTGAPARHFLKRAARTVHAKFILPEFSDVANAVGAVSGSVSEVREAIVFVRENEIQYSYVVKFGDRSKSLEQYREACDYAENIARKLAKEAAVKSGATDPYVDVERKTEGSLTRFIARAVGNPKLSEVQNVED